MSRQPRKIWPSAATTFSTIVFDDFAAFGSRGRNSAPMAYSPGAGSSKPSSRAFVDEEIMRNLHQHAAAVAGLGIGPDGAAMIEIEQDLEPHLDDLVRLAIMHVGDEADAAGVMFARRRIKPLRRGKPGIARSLGEAEIVSEGGGAGHGRVDRSGHYSIPLLTKTRPGPPPSLAWPAAGGPRPWKPASAPLAAAASFQPHRPSLRARLAARWRQAQTPSERGLSLLSNFAIRPDRDGMERAQKRVGGAASASAFISAEKIWHLIAVHKSHRAATGRIAFEIRPKPCK